MELGKGPPAILLVATIGGVRIVLPTGDPPLESLKIGAFFTILNSSFPADDVSTLVVFLGTNMNLGILEAEATFFLYLSEEKVVPNVSITSFNLSVLIV